MIDKRNFEDLSVPSPAKKEVKKTYPILGGNIDYNTAFTFVDKEGKTVQVRPAVKLSGSKGFKYPYWNMPIAYIRALIKLGTTDPDFMRVLDEIDEFELMDHL